MTKNDMRYAAIRSIRSIAKEMSLPSVSVEEAYKILDDLNRRDPQLVASIWWRNANDSQLKKFATEWRKLQK